MKRMSIVVWAIMLFVIIVPLGAFAQTPVYPHYDSSPGPVRCSTCHTNSSNGPGLLGTTSQSSPAVYNNICNSCHRPGDGAAGAKPLSFADQSVLFGVHSAAGTTFRQTSHRWDGSDLNPAAGAQPPILAGMTSAFVTIQGSQAKANLRGRMGNQLACARCHSVHNATNNTNFTRIPNEQDQMCLDCHRTRDTSLYADKQSAGTHPVNVNYNTANGSVKPVPEYATPASNLKLVSTPYGSQTIVCSTCHGVHFTDSRSSTYDGFSSVKGGRYNYANLSSGDGYLLRTDRRGAKVSSGSTLNGQDKLNICTNCHGNKRSHNAVDQNIQCNDCHSAHVEFDATSSVQSNLNPSHKKNVYLIRRNLSRAGTPTKVFFRYTGTQREYKNANNTGVCQGCHAVPAAGGTSLSGATYPPEHDTATLAKDCNACHSHNSQAGSFSGACGSCHGNPPLSGVIGNVGMATPATGALTTGEVGAHGIHVTTRKMDCNTCHDGYANRASMPSNSIDMGFAVNGGNFPGFKGNTINGKYITTSGLNNPYFISGAVINSGTDHGCSNVYCHGATLDPGTLPEPSWINSENQATTFFGAADCGSCHEIGLNGINKGSHKAHVPSFGNVDCDSCHGAGMHYDNNHVNGSVEWGLNGIAAGQYRPSGGNYATSGTTNRLAPSSIYGTCSVTCHGQGAPTWGAQYSIPANFPYSTIQCAKCHSGNLAGDVAVANPFYSTAIPKVTSSSDTKVGTHTAHLASVDSMSTALVCADCHGSVTLNNGTHMNGTTNFSWSGLATNNGTLTPVYSGGACSNTYCHGATLSGGTNKAPSWISTNYLPATLTTAACGTCHGFPPSSHGFTAASTFPAAAAECNACHPNVSATGSAYGDIFVLKSKHIDGTIDISGGGGACSGCHGYPPASPGFKGTHNNWSSAKVEDYRGAGGAHTISGHVKPTAKPSELWANCTNCHKVSDHATTPKVFTPSSNIKVSIEQRVRFSNVAPQAKYSSNRLDGVNHVTGNCSNISCHFQKTPRWSTN